MNSSRANINSCATATAFADGTHLSGDFCERAAFLGCDRSPIRLYAPRETILVVDAYADLCHIASILLSRCGYRVLTANSADEARQIATEHGDIDLLLTEVDLPGVSRGELAGWFRLVRPGTEIVYMSSRPAQVGGLEPCRIVENPFIRLHALVGEIRTALQAHEGCHTAAAA
jgi:CheY-like chemotaxis protein